MEWIVIEISPSRPKNLRHIARHVNSRRMIALHDAFNNEPEFDVECFKKTRAGSRTPRRYC
jgi:hypothetical protein